MSARHSTWILSLVLLGGSGLASAQDAYTSRPVNVHAGPDSSYPVVAQLGPGTPLDIDGCLDDWSWCEIAFEDDHGWVYAPYLSYVYEGERVPFYSYAPSFGIPIITFSLGSYWDRYYRGRPFYHERHDWERRPWHHERPPGPPPRAGVLPPRRGFGGDRDEGPRDFGRRPDEGRRDFGHGPDQGPRDLGRGAPGAGPRDFGRGDRRPDTGPPPATNAAPDNRFGSPRDQGDRGRGDRGFGGRGDQGDARRGGPFQGGGAFQGGGRPEGRPPPGAGAPPPPAAAPPPGGHGGFVPGPGGRAEAPRPQAHGGAQRPPEAPRGQPPGGGGREGDRGSDRRGDDRGR